jgi:hypothetical protein
MVEEGEGEAMDLEQPDTPPLESFGDASPTSSGGGDTAMDPPATVGPQLPPSPSGDQPFDMWAGQVSHMALSCMPRACMPRACSPSTHISELPLLLGLAASPP